VFWCFGVLVFEKGRNKPSVKKRYSEQGSRDYRAEQRSSLKKQFNFHFSYFSSVRLTTFSILLVKIVGDLKKELAWTLNRKCNKVFLTTSKPVHQMNAHQLIDQMAAAGTVGTRHIVSRILDRPVRAFGARAQTTATTDLTEILLFIVFLGLLWVLWKMWKTRLRNRNA